MFFDYGFDAGDFVVGDDDDVYAQDVDVDDGDGDDAADHDSDYEDDAGDDGDDDEDDDDDDDVVDADVVCVVVVGADDYGNACDDDYSMMLVIRE